VVFEHLHFFAFDFAGDFGAPLTGDLLGDRCLVTRAGELLDGDLLASLAAGFLAGDLLAALLVSLAVDLV